MTRWPEGEGATTFVPSMPTSLAIYALFNIVCIGLLLLLMKYACKWAARPFPVQTLKSEKSWKVEKLKVLGKAIVQNTIFEIVISRNPFHMVFKILPISCWVSASLYTLSP